MAEASLRTRILAAAGPLFEGGGRPSLDRVTRAAGVSRTSFYRVFASRAELIAALRLEPDPAARRLLLDAAGAMIGERGLASLAMDEVAERAGVSRATLYRLYPGKSTLFREVLRTFTPLETIATAMESMADRPPDEVMPELAVAAYRAIAAHPGVVVEIFASVVRGDPDTKEAVGYAAERMLGTTVSYVLVQMQEGRLRMIHPALAMQSFVGPILIHALTRRLAQELVNLQLDPEEAVRQLAQSWLRAMRPDP